MGSSGRGEFCSRCKEARETPRAAQVATGPNWGMAWTAAVMSCFRRCWPPASEFPTTAILFLDVDNKFRARQAVSQMAVFLFELANFFKQRIVLGLGAATVGSQCATHAFLALVSPVRQVGGVQAFATKHGADGSGLLGRFGLRQDAFLIVRGELAALGFGDHLGIGPRCSFTWHRAAFHLAALGFTPLRARRSYNGRSWWDAVCVFLHVSFLPRPLH